MSDWVMRFALAGIAVWLALAMTACSTLPPLSTVPSPVEDIGAGNVQVRLTDVDAAGGGQAEVQGSSLSVSGSGASQQRGGASGCIYTRLGTLTAEEAKALRLETIGGCVFDYYREVDTP